MARKQMNSLLGIAAMLIVGAAAWLTWKWYDGRYPAWDEEVRLSDGRVIVVKQKHEYYENYGTNQSWVIFSLPEMGGTQTWHSYLTPQRIDVIDGKVYVFGFPRGDRQYVHYHFPTQYMVGFVWDGSEFRRLPFLQIPELIRQEENLYSCVPTPRQEKLDLTIKDSKWCEPKGSEKQFVKKINLAAYQALSIFTADLHGTKPISE